MAAGRSHCYTGSIQDSKALRRHLSMGLLFSHFCIQLLNPTNAIIIILGSDIEFNDFIYLKL